MTKEKQDKNLPGGTPSSNVPDQGRSTGAVTLDRFRQVLRDRARMLAQEEQQDDFAELNNIHVLQFYLSGEVYAIEGKYVREVRVAHNITPIPCTPSFISGVVNLRGEIVTVLDTKQLLNLPAQERHISKLIVVRTEEAQMGFLVDDVIGVGPLSLQELQGPLATMPTEQAKRVTGLTGDSIILIDIQALIGDPRLVVDEEVYD